MSETPISKKKEILLIADKLFYDIGYKATTFNMIADLCEVTNPLITFHYKTKAALAGEITIIHNKSRKNAVAKKMYHHYGTYDLQIGTALEHRVFFKQIDEDPNVYRFFRERINADFTEYIFETSLSFQNAHQRRYHLNVNSDIDELRMGAYLYKGALPAMVFTYFEGLIDCSYDDFVNYMVSLPFKLMNLGQEDIDRIIKESKAVYDELDFQLGPYYEIK